MEMNLRVLGISAALASALSWALGSILYKKIGEEVPAASMNLVKGIISLLLLLAVVLPAGLERMDGGTLGLLAASGVLGIAVGDTLFFKALQSLGAHTVVSLGMLGQVLTILFAVLVLGESPTPAAWAGMALILAGVSAVLYGRKANDDRRNASRGIVYGALSVLAMTAGVLIAKKGIAHTSALQATFVRMLCGVAGLAAWGLCSRQLPGLLAPLRSVRLVKDISFAVCVATFGGFYLFHVALKYIDVSLANTLNGMEPVFVLPLAAVLLREKVRWPAAAGVLVAFGGIAFIFHG